MVIDFVKKLIGIILLFFFVVIPPTLHSQEAPVQINVSIDSDPVYAQSPISGLITITHSKNQKIDPTTFKLENKPLSVKYVKDVQTSLTQDLMLSIYRFDLPGQPKGLQLLPTISVNVGGSTIRSIPSTYEVIAIPTKAQPKKFLKLEAIIEGPNPLYPGQHVRLVYRFYFKGNIDLTKEFLPMLDVSGFRKLGSKEIQEGSQEGISIQEVSQEYAGRLPGVYTFPISYVEGYAYQEITSGNKVRLPPELRAESPANTLTVHPFPIENQPASFQGAVGNFQLRATLNQTADVHIGDTVKLALEVKGTEGLDTVTLPDLECQPGFSGRFLIKEISSVGILQGQTKRFTIELRPLFSSIKEIPSIELSFFDPKEKNYKTLRTPPIALNISPLTTSDLALSEDKAVIPPSLWKQSTQPENVHRNDIQEIMPLSFSDLFGFHLNGTILLSFISGGFFLLFFQIYYERTRQERRIEKTRTSQELFKEAIRISFGSPEFFNKLEDALFLRLVEIKEIASSKISPEWLSREGKSGLVRNFLLQIAEIRYSGKEQPLDKALLKQAKQLYELLNKP